MGIEVLKRSNSGNKHSFMFLMIIKFSQDHVLDFQVANLHLVSCHSIIIKGMYIDLVFSLCPRPFISKEFIEKLVLLIYLE